MPPTPLESEEDSSQRYYDDPLITPIKIFEGLDDFPPQPLKKLDAVKECSAEFRNQMLKGPRAKFYKSCDLVRVPYPTKYGFRDADAWIISPYLHVLNRLFVVQFEVGSSGTFKTLLVSPSDLDGNLETPYFKRIADQLGFLLPYIRPIISPVSGTVEYYLQQLGIEPDQVDYITYDHLHTQDLRKWLGDGTKPGFFPNAKLLIMREEWESTKNLLPLQADWYCPNGIMGVPEDRVVLLDHDVMLGDSVALLRTSGHTMGNHSIVVHTEDGLLVSSETGVSADCYSPYHSKIPGFKTYVENTGTEVVMNGNTLESSVEQYISMIKEREVAGPCPHNRDFYNVVPSSEVAACYLFPGVSPTYFHGNLEFGKAVVKEF